MWGKPVVQAEDQEKEHRLDFFGFFLLVLVTLLYLLVTRFYIFSSFFKALHDLFTAHFKRSMASRNFCLTRDGEID